MAEQAEADGIAAICATPHIRHDHDVHIGELPARRAEISRALKEAGCATGVLPGGEVAASALDGLDPDELAAVSLGGTRRWILLEPVPGPLGAELDRAVKQLERWGYRALIAHPERHLAPDLPERLRRLVNRGALIQATAAFLALEASRPGMLELARAGLIHVVGSDAHSSRHGRPVALSPALQVLATTEPAASHIEWIARTAPDGIIAGQDLTPPF